MQKLTRQVLITGGLGQLGYFLTSMLLLEEDVEITIVDNFSSNKIPPESLPTRVRIIKADVRNFLQEIDKIGASFDTIYHLAAQISVPFSMSNPIVDFEINSWGTLQVLEFARAHESQVIVVGSAATIGEPRSVPVSPAHPREPLSPYGASKAASEIYALTYYRSYGLPVTVVRPFNVYSHLVKPGDSYAGVISIFLSRAIQGLPLIIHGDGRQTRDFIYAEDVARIMVEISKRSDLWGQTIQVGTGEETSILELAELIIELTKSPSTIEFGAPRSGDIKRSVADISALKHYGLPLPRPLRVGLSMLLKRKEDPFI